MTNTFTVRNVAGDQYVEARFLTDASGAFIVSSNPIQKSWYLFDTDGNFIGTNVNGYVIVPASFDIKTAIDFGRSLAQIANGSNEGLAVANMEMINAFRPAGWLDLQTNYNGTSGDNIPAFRVAASYLLGIVGLEAGYSLDRIKIGGGVVNALQYLRNNVKDVSGDYFNSPDNVRSMTDGYQAQLNSIFSSNHSPLPTSIFSQSSSIDASGALVVSANFSGTGGEPLSILYTVDVGGGGVKIVLDDPSHRSSTYQVVGSTLTVTSDTSTGGVVSP